MKRIILAVLAIFLIAAPAAHAVVIQVPDRGFGLRGADLQNAFNEELFATGSGMMVRASFNLACSSDASAYEAELDTHVSAGLRIWPVAVWQDACVSGENVKINTSLERAIFAAFVGSLVDRLRDNYAQYGKAFPNVIEILNEPNCDFNTEGGKYTTGVYDDLFQEARTAARAQDSDIATIAGGLAFQQNSNCNDASNWINVLSGLSGYNGYSIHPYGYTNPSTYARLGMPAAPDTQATRAMHEANRACDEALDGSTDRQVYVTETGRPSGTADGETSSEGEQASFLSLVKGEWSSYADGPLFNSVGKDNNTTNLSMGWYTSPTPTGWTFKDEPYDVWNDDGSHPIENEETANDCDFINGP